MKNYEKYADEIREYKGTKFCNDFVQPHILKEISCDSIGCGRCRTLQMLWLLEEHKDSEKPEIDWSQVEVDTPILVKFKEDKEWVKRHFAKYENGSVYAWKDSHTSWTSLHNDDVTFWNYAKLTEDEKECKEPEVDWGKVEVDTPILVRQGENGEWLERHFAKYENGDVYAWVDGQTSWTGADEIKWKYAKLAENEELK